MLKEAVGISGQSVQTIAKKTYFQLFSFLHETVVDESQITAASNNSTNRRSISLCADKTTQRSISYYFNCYFLPTFKS